MRDYNKPILNKNGKPLKILESASHFCIRVVKRSRALRKLGYELHGLGDKLSYGTEEFETYSVWKNEKQFKNSIKMYIDMGVDVLTYSTEPDFPVKWIKEVVGDRNIPIIADLHDLDSIRRQIIPIPEREMFNSADGFIYVSKPIQKITNKLHELTKPNILLYSYCNDGIVEYKEEDIPKRANLVYEGGANPPTDKDLNRMFSYRSLYGIIKKLVSMGNETHMFCGNVSAFQTYQNTGAICYPPTDYDEMMEKLTKFKYGILIFNNEKDTEKQVTYTLTNKMFEGICTGLPMLACWCRESEKYVEKHGVGFVFKHIEEIGNCSQLENRYLDIMNNIKTKRKELVMENFIWVYENLMAELLGVEKKGIPDNIQKLYDFEIKD